jgi:transposase
VPATVQKLVHVMKKYGPCACAAFKGAQVQAVVGARAPAKIVPGSDFSNGSIAFFMIGKYQDAIPFYRMEKILERYGLSVSRATLCNLAIGVGRAIGPLIERMWRDARASPVILMDETRLQVLKEHGRRPESQSFMWVTLGMDRGKKVILYHYHPTRAAEVPRKALEGYEGYLQTDGYGGYAAIPGVKHVFCFAHMRRKFVEAEKIGSGGTLAREGIAFFDKVFSIESTLRKRLDEGSLTEGQFLEKRAAQVGTVVTELKAWLSSASLSVAAQSKLGHAISYAADHLELAARFVEHLLLTPSTNAVENAIRPFVVGRKNWLFSDTPRGAHASAGIYSIIETAKANGRDPQKYLEWLFDALPLAQTDADWEALLPYGPGPTATG